MDSHIFSPDELGFLEAALVKVLVAASAGKIDLNALARMELTRRGLSKHGHWIGFERAREQMRTEHCS